MSILAALVLTALSTSLAVGLMLPPPPRLSGPASEAPTAGTAPPASGRGRGRRAAWSGLAGVGAALFVGGPVAPLAGVGAGVAAWVVLGRSEDPRSRREREAAAQDLAHLVGLLASALRAGVPVETGVEVVCAALPGAAADRLTGVRRRLALGADPARVWALLAADEVLGPLGRSLERAVGSGAPVAPALERLAAEIGEEARTATEDRARAVGVRAAAPLGLCLLPAFLLVGIVPVAAGLLAELTP